MRPVEDALEWRGVHVARTPARHGTGEIGEAMAPASGFVLRAAGEPSIYIAGDTIWCDEVRATLDVQRPDIVVVNASGARFTEGDPIVMTVDDVVALTRHVPGAPVVAVHLDAINHCLESRDDLRARLRTEGLEDRVSVPEDGAAARPYWHARARLPVRVAAARELPRRGACRRGDAIQARAAPPRRRAAHERQRLATNAARAGAGVEHERLAVGEGLHHHERRQQRGRQQHDQPLRPARQVAPAEQRPGRTP